ncbi:MAG: hypothetical protein GEV08_21030, partial [Acidimicrobiia bacterium]|nr:hypothetical protein [Acidimicrobiia bacterium]
MDSGRTKLMVLFGGRSAEHDVSRVTAAHVLRVIDPARYEVTVVAIDRDGRWLLAEEAMAALGAGPEALPDALHARGPALDALGGDLAHPAIGLGVLLVIQGLNVYKPRGVT